MVESSDETGPGQQPEPAVPAQAAGDRVAAAARERTVQALTERYTADELTDVELEERLDRVYRATTMAELDAVVADLPALRQSAAASETASKTPAETVETIVATLSGHQRSMTGTVPRQMRLRSRLGNIELDLTRATFSPGFTEIDLRAFMGYVQVRFPAGIRVENHGHALLGFFAVRGGTGQAAEGSAVVRVSGRAILGFVECFAPGHG